MMHMRHKDWSELSVFQKVVAIGGGILAALMLPFMLVALARDLGLLPQPIDVAPPSKIKFVSPDE